MTAPKNSDYLFIDYCEAQVGGASDLALHWLPQHSLIHDYESSCSNITLTFIEISSDN
jgi:hypothetical protein